MDITLTLDQIKSAVNEAITAMTEFAHEQGLNGLAYDGLPALWQDADGHEFEVKRRPRTTRSGTRSRTSPPTSTRTDRATSPRSSSTFPFLKSSPSDQPIGGNQ